MTRDAIVLLSGSFNPIHRSHVDVVNAARRHLEGQGWLVHAGFIVPSSDEYVERKLGQQAMPFRRRSFLCRLALAGLDWITVTDWSELSGYRASRRLRESFVSADQQSPPVVVELMGSDTVLRLMDRWVAEWDEADSTTRQPWYESRVVYCVNRGGTDSDATSLYIKSVIAPRVLEFGIEIIVSASSFLASDDITS